MTTTKQINPFACGWFQVDYSDRLRRGEVRPFRAFDREFVLWRDEDGNAHLMDAFCRHLGTHLGHGGRVKGNRIQCPFHGWCFDGSGACAEIPYSPEARLENRGLGSLPLVERNGLLFAWWHPQGEAPEYSLPVIDECQDSQWSRYYRHAWTVPTVWYEIQENIVDSTHFHYLHGVDSLAEVKRCDGEGPILDVDIHHQFKTPDGVCPGFIQTTLYGPYFALVRFRIGDLAEILFIDGITVRGERELELNFSLMARLSGVQSPDMSLELVNEAIRQVSEDVPIWRHKARWERPSLAAGDGPIMKFRRWAAQFTPITEKTTANPLELTHV
jgi:nitrite reductase/ring-hydroxylating ferredoxin subunit